MFESLQERRENFFSPEFTFCADSYSVSIPLPPWPVNTPVVLPKVQVAYNLDPTKSKWADYTVQAECGNLSGTSSHATRQGTLGHSRLGLLSHCGLIPAKKVELVCSS